MSPVEAVVYVLRKRAYWSFVQLGSPASDCLGAVYIPYGAWKSGYGGRGIHRWAIAKALSGNPRNYLTEKQGFGIS